MKILVLGYLWLLLVFALIPYLHRPHPTSPSSAEFYPPVLFPLPFCHFQSLLLEAPPLRKSIIIRRVQEHHFLVELGNRPLVHSQWLTVQPKIFKSSIRFLILLYSPLFPIYFRHSLSFSILYIIIYLILFSLRLPASPFTFLPYGSSPSGHKLFNIQFNVHLFYSLHSSDPPLYPLIHCITHAISSFISLFFISTTTNILSTI